MKCSYRLDSEVIKLLYRALLMFLIEITRWNFQCTNLSTDVNEVAQSVILNKKIKISLSLVVKVHNVTNLSICYTMPTRGVSRIHEAITINPEGVA